MATEMTLPATIARRSVREPRRAGGRAPAIRIVVTGLRLGLDTQTRSGVYLPAAKHPCAQIRKLTSATKTWRADHEPESALMAPGEDDGVEVAARGASGGVSAGEDHGRDRCTKGDQDAQHARFGEAAVEYCDPGSRGG